MQRLTGCLISHFYSRPCGRGDQRQVVRRGQRVLISTHAPAGGATLVSLVSQRKKLQFLLTPLREGRPLLSVSAG